jgi:UDP-N-acetylglucosamine 2-epimerase (non-hydrolysing)
MAGKTIAVVLGIRPDIIRASIILELLQSSSRCDLTLIWSGQHYSDNLKDIFFRELGIRSPDVELGAAADSDADVVAHVVRTLGPILADLQPAAAVFLGDTNTVMGCVAAAQLNIPIVHIEGCMRSYDWRMPEEKYRVVVDHLSDVMYAYLEEYKLQGLREGLNPRSIVVTGNPIVDVLDKYYFSRRAHYTALGHDQFFRDRGLGRSQYLLMTCHRRENVQDRASLSRILELAGAAGRPVYFAASYRTQRAIAQGGHRVPGNVAVVDPVGYDEFLVLMTNARGVITDSGTVVEEACVLQVPAVQLRTATERPQVYDVGACVKFDPTRPDRYPPHAVLERLDTLSGRSWPNPFGDGKASQRIVHDLVRRIEEGDFRRHRPEDYALDISRAFRDDAP